jgi:hypothetical protein
LSYEFNRAAFKKDIDPKKSGLQLKRCFTNVARGRVS